MTGIRTTTRIFLALITISGVAVLGTLLMGGQFQEVYLKTTPGVRIAIILVLSLVLALCFTSIWLIVWSFRSPERFQTLLDRWVKPLENTRIFTWIVALSLAVAVICTDLLLQINLLKNTSSLPGDEYQVPLLLLSLFDTFLGWMLVLSLLSIPMIILAAGKARDLLREEFLRPFLIFVGLMILGFLMVNNVYGYQRTSIEGGIFRPTTYPVVGYQVLLALLGLGIYLLADGWIEYRLGESYRRISWLWDALIIVMVAFTLWNSAPVEATSFIEVPRPPNMDSYPRLDAVIYDRAAQHFLATGEFASYLSDDYRSAIGRRPMLILLYAGLHRLAGLGSREILPFQLLLFTAFPLLIYLFTSRISNRTAGIMAALLVIIRGWNGMALGSKITGVNLQMVMSDYPTAIGMVLILYLAAIWLEDRPQSNLLPLIIGGVIGATMLIRQEVVELVVPIGVLGFVILRKTPRKLIQGGLSLVLGIVLVISPWVIRNYQQTGLVYLDTPSSMEIFRKTLDLFKSDADNDQLVVMLPEQAGLSKGGRGFYQGSPAIPDSYLLQDQAESRGEVIVNHLVNGSLQSVLYLPNRVMTLDFNYLATLYRMDFERLVGGVLYSLEDYIRESPYWRWDWDGRVSYLSYIPVGFSVLLIAVGIAAAWQKRRWLVILPILTFVVELVIYALAHRSGGRYLITIDWIVAVFYSIGLIQLVSPLVVRNPIQVDSSIPERTSRLNLGTTGNLISYLGLAVGCLLVGMTPVGLERIVPNHYTAELRDERLIEVLDESTSPWTEKEREFIQEILEKGGEAHYGRALYPSYYLPEAVIEDTIEVELINSTSFYISGTSFDFVMLPSEEPSYFPQGADVLVVGCPDLSRNYKKEVCLGCGKNGLDALVVVILDMEGNIETILWRQGVKVWENLKCPLEDFQ